MLNGGWNSQRLAQFSQTKIQWDGDIRQTFPWSIFSSKKKNSMRWRHDRLSHDHPFLDC